MALEFRGVHADIIRDTTLERDIEGALSSGKTIACMKSEIDALKNEPGIWTLSARWTGDATDSLLRPAFEQMFRLEDFATWTWEPKQRFYEWPNGSRMFCFGLKTQSQDPEERFGKIRGLPVSRIYISQAEQFPADVSAELRSRMRPDIEAQNRGERFTRQLTFDANPVDDDIGPSGHWLAKQFPVNNSIPGRKYFCLSLFDNAHNLPPDFIAQQLAIYPPEHPKHRTMILGQRGLAVSGEPIFESLFDYKTHVRDLSMRSDGEFIDGLEIGKHNPCYLVTCRTPVGGLLILGGILGQGLVLEDFIPLVKHYRAQWGISEAIPTCIAPIGKRQGFGAGTMAKKLRSAGFRLHSQENANNPNVQLSMIEHIAGMLRQRTVTREECIGINADPSRWLSISRDGVSQQAFMRFAFEGGYTWSKNFVSVSHKELRQPVEDDKYANAMHCLENIVLNFVADKPNAEDARKAAEANRRTMPRVDRGPNAWMA